MAPSSSTQTVGASCKRFTCVLRTRIHTFFFPASVRYSGDTVPTQKLVQAGENATLLIHESTMADDQADLAAAKMHSTVGQAIDVGKRYEFVFFFSLRVTYMETPLPNAG